MAARRLYGGPVRGLFWKDRWNIGCPFLQIQPNVAFLNCFRINDPFYKLKIIHHRERTRRTPASTSCNLYELKFPTFSVKNDLSTVINWETFATEFLGRLVSFLDRRTAQIKVIGLNNQQGTSISRF
jgi:hypothetical protein